MKMTNNFNYLIIIFHVFKAKKKSSVKKLKMLNSTLNYEKANTKKALKIGYVSICLHSK